MMVLTRNTTYLMPISTRLEVALVKQGEDLRRRH